MIPRTLSIASLCVLAGACSRSHDQEPPFTETRSGEVRLESPRPVDDGTKAKAPPAVKAKDPLTAADGDMQKVLNELAALGPKPLPTLTPEEARKQPTPADAVKSLLTKQGKSTAPIAMAKVEDRKIDGPAGKLDVRIYTPRVKNRTGLLPVVTYFHGGGFAIANNDVYDSSARALADESHAIVVAADYRHAPEHKFPAAHDDAFAAYRWVLGNASSFGGDAKRVAVAGESAGGNLAINVAIAARDARVALPVHQLLVYPVASSNMESPSYQEWTNGKPLDRPMMGWFMTQYARTPADAQDPRIDVVNANLVGLPPTTVILAEIDPLRSDGEALVKKLEAASVRVEKKTYEGVTHEFFGMGAAVADAKAAVAYAGDRLEDGFMKKN